jgi:hypothetical protein
MKDGHEKDDGERRRVHDILIRFRPDDDEPCVDRLIDLFAIMVMDHILKNGEEM